MCASIIISKVRGGIKDDTWIKPSNSKYPVSRLLLEVFPDIKQLPLLGQLTSNTVQSYETEGQMRKGQKMTILHSLIW